MYLRDFVDVELLKLRPSAEDAATGGSGAVAGSKDGKVTVKKIAEEMGISMWHLNRLFKKIVGCPPQQWAQEQRKRKRDKGR